MGTGSKLRLQLRGGWRTEARLDGDVAVFTGLAGAFVATPGTQPTPSKPKRTSPPISTPLSKTATRFAEGGARRYRPRQGNDGNSRGRRPWARQSL